MLAGICRPLSCLVYCLAVQWSEPPRVVESKPRRRCSHCHQSALRVRGRTCQGAGGGRLPLQPLRGGWALAARVGLGAAPRRRLDSGEAKPGRTAYHCMVGDAWPLLACKASAHEGVQSFLGAGNPRSYLCIPRGGCSDMRSTLVACSELMLRGPTAQGAGASPFVWGDPVPRSTPRAL